jgi:Fatty acid desaturase.
MLLGVLPWRALGFWYLVVSTGLALNALRTLAAHRYRNHARTPMSISEQFLDSVDVPGQRWLTGLWAPVGLRYHATHHLFPGMPYHNLGTAYRRLAQAYPDCYTAATRRSLLDALGALWRAHSEPAERDPHRLQTSGTRRA